MDKVIGKLGHLCSRLSGKARRHQVAGEMVVEASCARTVLARIGAQDQGTNQREVNRSHTLRKARNEIAWFSQLPENLQRAFRAAIS